MNHKQINVSGPFWQAKLDIVELSDPIENQALRHLFLTYTPPANSRRRAELAPGTLLLLARPQRVELRGLKKGDRSYTWTKASDHHVPAKLTAAEMATHLRAGDLALLLVTAQDSDYVCLAGEIALDNLQIKQADEKRLFERLQLATADPGQRQGTAGLRGRLSVHASGLSVYGAVTLPWLADTVAAPFLLTEQQPGSAARLTIDADRLTGAERANLIRAWNRFSAIINPYHPLNDAAGGTAVTSHWVTLEISNPQDVPRLHWLWQPDTAAAPGDQRLYFAAGQINLLLSDRKPYDQQNPPQSLARVELDDVQVERQDNDLHITITTGAAPQAAANQLIYTYTKSPDAAAGQEQFQLPQDLDLAFDALATADSLRRSQAIPAPEWTGDQPLAQPILWGFMPLADGWAQLPIPNLTEQIYLDAELEQFETAPAESSPTLWQGAVAYGNDDRAARKDHPAEQPWDLTLTDAQHLAGQWLLVGQEDGFQLRQIELTIQSPKLAINGLFWLSTGQPTAADALPSLENWVTGLETIPLKWVDPTTDLFPSLVTLRLNGAGEDTAVTLHHRHEPHPSAQLGPWSLAYTINQPLLAQMQAKNVLPDELFAQHLPWVWRRHARLPMVQALPLTQSLEPPNHPSPSRQLVPYQLAAGEPWRFGLPAAASNGAATWPHCLSSAAPAPEWLAQSDLPLVSLSLPGLILDPMLNDTGLGQDGPLALAYQYRFDLPYTDEVNALAQLPPPTPPDPEKVSPLPDSPVPEPPRPLTRDTFAAHWQRLAEQAALAGAYAVQAFRQENGQPVLQNLIEPHVWPVQPQLNLDSYPGTLDLAGSQLSQETALRGVSGTFQLDEGDGRLQPAPADAENPFRIEAGSMAAHRGADGTFRDQRGLSRAATQKAAPLLKTAVHLDGQTYDLTTTLNALPLRITGEQQWQFWFKDLPLMAGAFRRADVLSAAAQDVNDPDALSREHNFRAGYEWRLGETATSIPLSAGVPDTAWLPLFHLRFYPLTLEKVSLNGDAIDEIELIGRLQLPLAGEQELTDFSNAVRLRFQQADDTLTLTAVNLESEQAEWPLFLSEGEDSDAPHLFWRKIRLNQPGKRLELTDVVLEYFLFGEKWTIDLDQINFATDSTIIDIAHTFSKPKPADAFFPQQLALQLDLDTDQAAHTVTLQLGVKLGDSQRAAFTADVQWQLLGAETGSISWQKGTLFGQMAVVPETAVYTPNALQFHWTHLHSTDETDWQLLPGLHIARQANTPIAAPGFAALTFTTTSTKSGIPQLTLAAAFMETLLTCRWGQLLQAPAAPTPEQLFGSSAGALMMGYTLEWQAPAWTESFLLNGVLEIKNLISWPQALIAPADQDPQPTNLILPALPDDGQLHHARHTIRILFNQHAIPPHRLTPGAADGLLFTLADDHPWSFLAVVEHQLIGLQFDGDLAWQETIFDQRWTALQEIRLLTPPRMQTYLHDYETAHQSDGSLDALTFGYFEANLRGQLTDALAQLPTASLIVEASAPHWVKRDTLTGTSMTTLQFLPNGSQHGMMSQPQDFAPSDPADPAWLLLTMPFLGRLQPQTQDEIASEATTPLQVDPVLALFRQNQQAATSPAFLLALTHWSPQPGAPAQLRISGLDSWHGRTFTRLDPTTLEENWFRLQIPWPEPAATSLPSIMATLADGPARLSRSTALQTAFESFRPFYPPAVFPPLADGDPEAILWRHDSWLIHQGTAVLDTLTPAQPLRLPNPELSAAGQTAHPLKGDAISGAAVAGDSVPGHWSLFKFPYRDKQFEDRDVPVAVPTGQSKWGVPRLRRPDAREMRIIRHYGPADDPLMVYADSAPVWLTLGQELTLAPGRYRFSMELFPLQWRDAKPNSKPPITPPPADIPADSSQVWLFAGDQASAVYQGNFHQWNEVSIEFEVKRQGKLPVGAVLYGKHNWPRNGWLLRGAAIERVGQSLSGWHLVAAQLQGIVEGTAVSDQPTRHAAATLLPTPSPIDGQDNPRPLSLAVTPYLGLDFKPAGTATTAQLVAAELLCLDQANRRLRPLASHLWDLTDKTWADSAVQVWAYETQRRLSPDSPLAILRLREIHQNDAAAENAQAQLTTIYRFELVNGPAQAETLARRVFRLRTGPAQLRFREGQFGGFTLPAGPKPFQLAPPQTTGVQPLYFTERPDTAVPGEWPWGLSALRLSLQYTPAGQGVIGHTANGDPLTLWWQAPQHMVQYRPATARNNGDAGQPAAGLPALFRAAAIKSLLPALPTPALPQLDSTNGLQTWQPILPGVLRYLLTGARPGVMLAIRSQLISQTIGLAASQPGLVSGAVPVQHRVPRPVPLPANRADRRDKALQTWASYFEPQTNLLAATTPADEAFFAACGAQPARRLRLTLQQPAQGLVASDWSGELQMRISHDSDGSPAEIEVADWVQVTLTMNGRTWRYLAPQKLKEPTGTYHFTLNEPDQPVITELLASQPAGAVITVNAFVGHAEETDGFRQNLTFPLRVASRSGPSLPLEPCFIHFEDPEYNRRLASSAAIAASQVLVDNVLHTVTLATDRREYNPDSQLALRYDWDDDRKEGTAVLQLACVKEGSEIPLHLASGMELQPGKLQQFALADLLTDSQKPIEWQQGDVLQLTAKVNETLIVVTVSIVTQSVIPAPEAAFALLRWQHNQREVECVRFAWQPAASRVELICPEDLRTEVVRRRAVFQWTDSVRPTTCDGYAIQKITQSGSTHFPQPV